MAIINAALISALQVTWKNDFQKAFDKETPDDWQKIATVIKSNSKSNTYGWLGQFPAMRKWVGDRVLNNIKEHAYSIVNDDFEATIEVKRTDIEDDEVGIYTPLFKEMGRSAKAQPNEMVFPLLAAGFTKTCYDGQNFFDVDHPVYPKADGTGTAATVSNMTAGSKEPWYLLDTSRAIGPIIFQDRKAPVFTNMNKSDDEHVFTANKYRYGVDARNNSGYGLWQMAHGSKTDLNSANFNEAFDKMCALKTDGNRPLGIMPNILVVSTANRVAAEAILKAREIAGGGTNVDYQRVELLVTPWL